MANNFHFINDDQNQVFYISKSGLTSMSSERRGNRNNPLPSVADYLASGNEDSLGFVGTGMYSWGTSFARGATGSSKQNLVADGYVEILGDRQTRFAALIESGSTYTGLHFEQFAGFNFRSYYYGNGVAYQQCTFKVLPSFASAPNSSVSGGVLFEDCVFLNVSWGPNAGNMSFTRCLFFNCTSVDQIGSLTNCYLDPTCALRVANTSNNNVDPACNVATGFGLNVGGAGFTLASPGGISEAPLFNNLALDDFSLQAGSPHLDAGIGPAQWRQGRSFVAQYTGGASETVGAGNTRFAPQDKSATVAVESTTGVLDTTAQGGLIIRASETADGIAHLRTGRILHAEGVPYEISQLTALGGYNFDTAYPAKEEQLNLRMPEVYNNNVFALSQFAAGEAGRNPARLTYGIRWSTLPSPRPDHAEDWVTGDTFVECEWNTRPLYNRASLVGNGRPDFVTTQAEPIVCTWYQLLLGLSNVYYH
ncbi:MAG: hypothetical protein ACRYG7_08790 [Janthinobacterium lividum]